VTNGKRSVSLFVLWWGVWCVIIMIGFVGCHGPRGVSTTLFQEPDGPLQRIAVLPFQFANPEDFAHVSEVVSKPASKIKLQAAADAPEAKLEEMFWTRLLTVCKIPLVSPAETGAVYSEIVNSSVKMSFPEALRRLGERLEADVVLVGLLYRYRERRGYDYSVEKPASIYFEVQMYRCRDGVLLWRGVFDKTQTSLMEDVLEVKSFIKERGRWVRVKELAQEGVEQILSRLPFIDGLPPKEARK